MIFLVPYEQIKLMRIKGIYYGVKRHLSFLTSIIISQETNNIPRMIKKSRRYFMFMNNNVLRQKLAITFLIHQSGTLN